MSLLLKQLVKIFEKKIPLTYQETWDRSGLQFKGINPKVSRVLFVYDVTRPVLRYAAKKKFELIVTHHPLYLGKRAGEYEKSLIVFAKKHKIAIYTAHTSHDNSPFSVSRYYAGLLKLRNLKPIVHRSGLVGNLAQPMTAAALNKKVKKIFKTPLLRFSGNPKQKIKKVALCTGSGTGLLPTVIAQKIPYFITGDVKYHYGADAKRNDVCLVDVGHYYSEIISVKLLKNIFKELFDDSIYLEEYRGLTDVFTNI
ncbi:Nif3-like dinuclear metal center hexameric protein [bacterium]|nr:Nif3-like dinuclear metal center hexameric protein [bacterium]